MIYHFFQRGVGLFRLLFSIDDFFRLITLTILLPVFASWLGLPKWIVILAFAIGVLMDMYDFLKEVGPGMTLSINDFNPINIIRRKNGLVKFIFAIHDVIQIAAMTILIPLFLNWIGIRPPLLTIGVVLGIVIDAHDFMAEFSSGKVTVEDD